MNGPELMALILEQLPDEQRAFVEPVLSSLPASATQVLMEDLEQAFTAFKAGDLVGAEAIAARYGVPPGMLQSLAASIGA